MKLAVSSLAWSPAEDDVVRGLLEARGIRGVELAPLKYWPLLHEVTPATLAESAARWAESGIATVALQGILFGMSELRLFGSRDQQEALERHLLDVVRVAAGLGARSIVFGAPGNRIRGALSEEEAIALATPLLRRVGAAAHDAGCVVGMEATPLRYGGDFGRSIAEVRRLVAAVDHPGIGLHLDAGAIAIVGEEDPAVRDGARVACHFHVSEIDLLPVGAGTVDHRRIAGLLRDGSYDRWCSLEMRPLAPDSLIPALDAALDVAQLAYGT